MTLKTKKATSKINLTELSIKLKPFKELIQPCVITRQQREVKFCAKIQNAFKYKNMM